MPRLSNRQLYDYRDIDRTELKLIRIGHALWAILRRERRQNSLDVPQEQALYEAIETMVRLKTECRAELKAKREQANEKVKQYFKERNESNNSEIGHNQDPDLA